MNNKKIILIILGTIVMVGLLFYIYIWVGAKGLDNGYDYNKLKEEITNKTKIKYEELPRDLINAVMSELNSDNQLLNGIGKWSTKISYLILRDNNMIKNYDDVSLKSLKLAYLASHTIKKDFTNEELLAYYLNVTGFGINFDGEAIYGIIDAAHNYFDKEVNELSLSQCATLGGILEAPGRYNPHKNHNEAVEKRNQVLEEMYNDGYITKVEKETAENEELLVIAISPLVSQ